MSERKYFSYHMEMGGITVVCEGAVVREVGFGIYNPQGAECCRTELSDRVAKQLGEYFEGARTEFELPLEPEGTAFQKSVWKALETIPYGETRCYSEVAEMIGNPKAARAIGMANHNNPIGICIPCHRVVGKNGKLVGYAAGTDKKKTLLELEQGIHI